MVTPPWLAGPRWPSHYSTNALDRDTTTLSGNLLPSFLGSAAMTDWAQLYRDHVDAVTGLAADLDDEQLATRLPATPAWTVHDVLAHLAGGPADGVARTDGGRPGPGVDGAARRRAGRACRSPSWSRSCAPTRTRPPPRPSTTRGPAVVWDIAVHHADLHEALGRHQLPGHFWEPVLDVRGADDAGRGARGRGLRGPEWGAGGAGAERVEVPPYELFRALFSRRSRAQMRAWGSPGPGGRRSSTRSASSARARTTSRPVEGAGLRAPPRGRSCPIEGCPRVAMTSYPCDVLPRRRARARSGALAALAVLLPALALAPVLTPAATAAPTAEHASATAGHPATRGRDPRLTRGPVRRPADEGEDAGRPDVPQDLAARAGAVDHRLLHEGDGPGGRGDVRRPRQRRRQDAAAVDLQHPRPRLRAVLLAGRPDHRRLLQEVDREGRRGRHGASTRSSCSSRTPCRSSATRSAPGRATGSGCCAGPRGCSTTRRRLGLPRRRALRLAVARAHGTAAQAGRRRAGPRLQHQHRQLPPDRRREGLRPGAGRASSARSACTARSTSSRPAATAAARPPTPATCATRPGPGSASRPGCVSTAPSTAPCGSRTPASPTARATAARTPGCGATSSPTGCSARPESDHC